MLLPRKIVCGDPYTQLKLYITGNTMASVQITDWQPEELAVIFRYHMTAPVQLDAADNLLSAIPKPGLQHFVHGYERKSFGDLFTDSRTPLELLIRIKNAAKRSRLDTVGSLPPAIATVLYYTSISAALIRWDQRITNLDDMALRKGLDWAIAKTWIDDSTRQILVQGREVVDQLS